VTTQTDNPAHRVLKDYAAAVLAKDLTAFMSLYDPGIFVFDSWDVWSYEGVEAWSGMTQEWFTSLGAERVAVEFTDERSSLSPTLAYAAATVRYTALSATGQSLRSLQNRITIVLELKNGKWQIVHQHRSSPIDFETKAALLHSH